MTSSRGATRNCSSCGGVGSSVSRFVSPVEALTLKSRPLADEVLYITERLRAHLQLQLDTFRADYNQQRPHRALGGRTPLIAWNARLKAGPSSTAAAVHYRVRQDRVGANGTVTLRYQSRLRHIPVGTVPKHEPVRLLIADDNVRIVAEDGALLRELTIDPSRDYQSLQSSAMT